MIKYVSGSILDQDVQVLVNSVNCVGVMGKGIALGFKNKYPSMFKKYKEICNRKLLEPGKLLLLKETDKWILNFPTKDHWKNNSKLEYIENGLKKFTQTYKDKNITSIAFPKLGCTNGGLNWEEQVKPLMEKYLNDLDIEIYVVID